MKALLLQVNLTYCQVCLQPLSVGGALWDRRLNNLATEFYDKCGLDRQNFERAERNYPRGESLFEIFSLSSLVSSHLIEFQEASKLLMQLDS